MDQHNDKKTPIIEVIFDGKQYVNTKKTLAVFYSVLLIYFQFTNRDFLAFTIVFISTVIVIIYFIYKLSFYNTMRQTRDITYLILFVLLLFWGIHTFYTVF